MNPKDLLVEALRLAPDERAKLAGQLLESLDEEDEGDVEAAWAAEIKRRVDDLDAGRAKSVPWSQVRQELHEIVKK